MFAFFQFTSIKVNPYSKAERKSGTQCPQFPRYKAHRKKKFIWQSRTKKVGHSVHNFRDAKPTGKRNSHGKAERKKWDTVSTISEMQSPQAKEIHMAKRNEKKWDTVSTISEMQSPQEKEIHMAK